MTVCTTTPIDDCSGPTRLLPGYGSLGSMYVVLCVLWSMNTICEGRAERGGEGVEEEGESERKRERVSVYVCVCVCVCVCV